MGVGQKTHMFKDGGATLGACCNYGGGGTSFCFNTTETNCNASGGSYSGDGVYCLGSGVCASPLDCCGVVAADGCGFTCSGQGISACSCNDCSSAGCWDCATVDVVYNVYCQKSDCSSDILVRTCNITFDVTDVSGSVCTHGASNNSITWKTCGSASESGDCIWVKLDLDHNEAAGGTALPWTWGIDNSPDTSSVCWAPEKNANGCGDQTCFGGNCVPTQCGAYGPYPTVTTNTCTSYEETDCELFTCFTLMSITLNCSP